MRTSILAWLLGALLLCFSAYGFASSLEDLAEQGYAVIEQTKVSGTFNGCDFDKKVPLTNGLLFVCRGYGYSYSYYPDVLILKNIRNGYIKVLIDGEEYDGTLERG